MSRINVYCNWTTRILHIVYNLPNSLQSVGAYWKQTCSEKQRVHHMVHVTAYLTRSVFPTSFWDENGIVNEMQFVLWQLHSGSVLTGTSAMCLCSRCSENSVSPEWHTNIQRYLPFFNWSIRECKTEFLLFVNCGANMWVPVCWWGTFQLFYGHSAMLLLANDHSLLCDIMMRHSHFEFLCNCFNDLVFSFFRC